MDGHVVRGIIRDVDQNAIAFSNIDRRPRKHAIYGNYWLGMAQPTHVLHLNLKMQF